LDDGEIGIFIVIESGHGLRSFMIEDLAGFWVWVKNSVYG